MTYRTRFKKDIVCEFLPPARQTNKQRVIVVCDGMPSVPKKQPLIEFLAGRGYWAFYPRYRGAWESGGEFLARSPHEDVLDVIGELPKGFREAAFCEKFEVDPDAVFVIGGSFGGAAALLCSLDPRVKRVLANCPVVDWSILGDEEKHETSNPDYAAYIRESFGNAYRLKRSNWEKLKKGRFFNPMAHANEMDLRKIMMIHAKDDPYVPWESVAKFADRTGAKLKLLRSGGHLKTERVVRKYWAEISKFLR